MKRSTFVKLSVLRV